MKTRISMIGAAALAAMLGAPSLAASSLAAPADPPVAATPAVEYIPRVSLRDLPLFDRVLSLDEAQRSILEALIMDVEAAGATRDALMEFRENIGAVLTESQAARLEEAWRTIFRERMEAAGSVAGESIDVGALALAQMRGESTEPIERAFRAYRAELGPLLDAREAAAALSLIHI